MLLEPEVEDDDAMGQALLDEENRRDECALLRRPPRSQGPEPPRLQRRPPKPRRPSGRPPSRATTCGCARGGRPSDRDRVGINAAPLRTGTLHTLRGLCKPRLLPDTAGTAGAVCSGRAVA